METIVQSHISTTISKENTVGIKKTTSKTEFWENMEFNRLAVVTITLLTVACFSGIVAGFFVDGRNQIELTAVILPTMLTLCCILAVTPIRWILATGIVALLVDIFMIIF